MEDPTTKRHRPRNYLETLEQRVALLESLLRRYRPDLANDHLIRSDHLQQEYQSGPVAPAYPPDHPHRAQSSISMEHEIGNGDKGEDGIDELASKAGLLSLNAAGAEPYYLGSSSTFAFSRLINSSLRRVVPEDHKTSKAFVQPENEQDFLPAPCLLPDYAIAVKLSDAYFQNIHTQYPFLHEPTFRFWESALLSGLTGIEPILSNPVALFFLNMVGHKRHLMVQNVDSLRCMPLVL